mmetsp:Transcript_27180/g.55905  ORF Transcript_27180/g.55905 Transcript_27180/m.55905 type:complete len:954 (-) Transcript_27180:42-2903(-)
MFGVTRKKPRPSNNRRRLINSRDSGSGSSSEEDGEKSKESRRSRANLAAKIQNRRDAINDVSDGDDGSSDSDADSRRRRRSRHREKSEESKKEKKKQSKKAKKSKSKKIRGNVFLSFDSQGEGEGEVGGGSAEDDAHYGKSRDKSKKNRKKHSKDHDGSERGRSRGKSSSSSKFGGMGLGYGGGAMALSQSSEEDNSAGEDGAEDIKPSKTAENTAGGSLYDEAALEKLKMEQKTRLGSGIQTSSTQPMEVDVDGNEGGSVPKFHGSSTIKEIDLQQGNADEEEQFIPLYGENTANIYNDIEPIVLTGDDAMAYANDDDEEQNDFNAEVDHGLHRPPPTSKEAAAAMDIDLENNPPTKETHEENRQWENEVARRAGVLPTTPVVDDNTDSTRCRSRRTAAPGDAEEPTLTQIKSSLQPTIKNLQIVLSDLDTAIHRHESTVTSANEEAKKLEAALEKHGKALEYYQCLREDLATWMGALRELKKMVDLAEDAKHQWEGEITWRRKERAWEWQEDVADVLENKGLLEKSIVGDGQSIVPTSINKSQPTVDEFGRDLTSMATMARTKRWERRRQIFIRRRNGNSGTSIEERTLITNEDNISNEEISDWKQRHQAFSDAIALVPMMVQDEYLSTYNLCKMFLEWERQYPDDYKNCYAAMTLVQMISVLVRLELCQRWDTLALHESLDNDENEKTFVSDLSKFKWCIDLNEAFSNADGPKNNGLLTNIIHKCVVPQFTSVLTIQDMERGNLHGLYDPFSPLQTKRLCFCCTSILQYLDSCLNEKGSEKRNEFLENTTKSLLSVLQYNLESEAIPIVKSSDITIVDDKFMPRDSGANAYDDETSDAIAYAMIIQTKSLSQLAVNMIDWLSVLDKAIYSPSDELSSLTRCVFVDLVSVRILPIIQSLHGISSHELFHEFPKEIIGEIYGAATRNGLLEKNENILLSAPLRVAAQTTTGI